MQDESKEASADVLAYSAGSSCANNIPLFLAHVSRVYGHFGMMRPLEAREHAIHEALVGLNVRSKARKMP